MDKSKNHDILTNLKEMILDEQKQVTYISLSKELCLHVNESKLLLRQIVDDLKKNNTELNVNYVISGLLDDTKAQTSVVNETELSALKTKFKTIFYQHVYSVGVGTPSTNNISLLADNKFEDFPLCTGLIKSNLCVKRTSDEIGTLKTNSQEISGQKPNVSVKPKDKNENSSMKNGLCDIKHTVGAQTHDTKLEHVIKCEITSPKKESTNKNLQKTDTKSAKSQKGIAGFFSKPSTNSSKKISSISTEPVRKSNVVENTEIKDNIAKIKTEKMDEDIPKNVVVENGNGNLNVCDKKVNKTLNQIKKTAKLDKKRKRVLHVSDSESDDEKNDPFTEEPDVDQDSEDEIPPTPLVNTVKITSGIINPKKKRKIVDKTYTDEDGYILTKKEEVYESCSENEEEVHVKENVQKLNKVEISPPEKKNGKKITKKKIASPIKGKQSTLMSFFKKV